MKFRCGHDKTPDNSRRKKDGAGRYYPTCRICYRATEERRRQKRRIARGELPHSRQTTPAEAAIKFPIEPLLTYIQLRTLTIDQERAVQRAKKNGRLTLVAADKVACAIGVHPCLIWPEWFADVVADEEEAA
jgi:hypothetical protein